jgi:hypothetical protein
MKLKIEKVIDYGTHASERIEFSVVTNCNLHYYIVADTSYTSESTISNKMRHTHWFKNKDVKAGDKVILYTKKGTASSTTINGGKNTQYTLYWGLDNYVWNNSGDAALLFEINTWKTTQVVPLKK